MKSIKELIVLLNKMEKHSIWYRLDKCRDNAIMIEVTVPGEKWEIEVLDTGEIQVERFYGKGEITGKEDIVELFQQFGEL